MPIDAKMLDDMLMKRLTQLVEDLKHHNPDVRAAVRNQIRLLLEVMGDVDYCNKS